MNSGRETQSIAPGRNDSKGVGNLGLELFFRSLKF